MKAELAFILVNNQVAKTLLDMIDCAISAGDYLTKEGKLLGAMLRGRARALHSLWPSPITLEMITLASGQAGKEEQGRGTVASFAMPLLVLSTLPPGLPPSLPALCWLRV